MQNRYIIAALFVVGAAIGFWGELMQPPSAWFGALVLPGVFLSLCLDIGPHGSAGLFEWAWPLCNGVVYAGIMALALWLRARLFKLTRRARD